MPSLSSLHPLLLGIGASMLLPAVAKAQCALQWQESASPTGLHGLVRTSVTWDPDGAGPRTPLVVLGGHFTSGVFGSAGPRSVNYIAAWDPSTSLWQSFGTGMNGAVTSLTVLPTGTLIAGGEFTQAGGVACSHVAAWNGVRWAPLAQGLNDDVLALAASPTGNLIAGGAFTMAGGASASRLATWNGAAWSELAGGVDDSVFALQFLRNGDLVVGGRFGNAGTSSLQSIARWDGAAWHAMGSMLSANHPPLVVDLDLMPNGDLAVAGQGFFFSPPFSFHYSVARWNGSSWSSFGPELLFRGNADIAGVQSVTPLPNGHLIAAGLFDSDGTRSLRHIARSDGTTWHALGVGLDDLPLTTLLSPTGEVIAGGSFGSAGTIPCVSVARWDGNLWSALGPEQGQVLAGVPAVALPNGNGTYVVGGDFSRAGALPLGNIGTCDGTRWTPLGSGVDGPVDCMLRLPNGDLVVGGTFQNAGGSPARNIARWDGSAWHALGQGIAGNGVGVVRALAMLPNGEVVAGGTITGAGGSGASLLARWNGSTWSSYPPLLGAPSVVSSLLVTAQGDLHVGSNSLFLPGSVQRWTGSSWQQLGTLQNFGNAEDLLIDRSGSIIAVGFSGVQSWNGSQWTILGSIPNGQVNSAASLPNGDLLVVGSFTEINGVRANGIARLTGSAWRPVDGGVTGQLLSSPSHVVGMVENELLICGRFTSAGTRGGYRLARLATTCPASVSSIPTTCAGPSGPVHLSADALPYAGGELRTTATGFTPTSFGIVVLGVSSPNLPLSSPQCRLLASLNFAVFVAPRSGMVTLEVLIPRSPEVIGLPFFHQVLLADTATVPPSVASSNALSVVIGGM